jgi:hypothetical protein
MSERQPGGAGRVGAWAAWAGRGGGFRRGDAERVAVADRSGVDLGHDPVAEGRSPARDRVVGGTVVARTDTEDGGAVTAGGNVAARAGAGGGVRTVSGAGGRSGRRVWIHRVEVAASHRRARLSIPLRVARVSGGGTGIVGQPVPGTVGAAGRPTV